MKFKLLINSFLIFSLTIFSDEIEVQTTIIKYLRIVSLSYIFWGWSNIASAAFNGFQKPMHATIVFLGRLFVLTVPMILIGDYFYGLAGIFYAICIANIFSGIIGPSKFAFKSEILLKFVLSNSGKIGSIVT